MSEGAWDIINYIFIGIAAVIFLASLCVTGVETKNEMDYFQILLEKVKDGTITEDEHAYLLRKLSRNG